MPLVRVRPYRFSAVTHDGTPEVGDLQKGGEREIEVDFSELVVANARVTSKPGRTGFWARHHELRLLLCLVEDREEHLRLKGDEFQASAGHIRRLVSETVGMGMLTGTASHLYEWQPGRSIAANLDVIPHHLVAAYKTTGVRPDLLYFLDDAYIAGEARGRSSPAPGKPSTAQRRRLNQLLTWSAELRDHPFFMSWTSLSPTGTVVDFFDHRLDEGPRPDPSDPVPTPPGFPPSQAPDEHLPDALRRLLDAEPPDTSAADVRPTDPSPRRPGRPRAAAARRGRLGQRAREVLLDAEDQLFDTSPLLPSTQDRLLDRQVRGAWAPLDLFGPTGRHFFLGVLDEGFTEDDAARLSRPRGPRDPRRDLDTQITGRLVAAVTRTPSSAPPPLSELARALSPRA
ncbi:hypothetical protein [Actinocorallia aurantiaca]|uniref:Uncharacterized protein n=1 Tax=Actinocorallia aurantiaca TaxID=46204 RepID=A0ABN3U497_9ACTN